MSPAQRKAGGAIKRGVTMYYVKKVTWGNGQRRVEFAQVYFSTFRRAGRITQGKGYKYIILAATQNEYEAAQKAAMPVPMRRVERELDKLEKRKAALANKDRWTDDDYIKNARLGRLIARYTKLLKGDN